MQKIIKYVSFIFMLNTLVACSSSSNTANNTLSKNTLPFIVDVRTPEEFEAGNIETSVNIPLQDIEKNIAKFKNKNKIIVYCRSGNRSSQAKTILNNNGITNVTDGGAMLTLQEQLKH